MRNPIYPPFPPFTAKEKEIEKAIAEKTYELREIAQALNISLQTVKNHLRSMYKKLGIDGAEGISKKTILAVLIHKELAQRSSLDQRGGQLLREGLTPRELDVLPLIVDGRSDRAISLELGITERTVKRHLQSMLDKTGSWNRTVLAVRAASGNLGSILISS